MSLTKVLLKSIGIYERALKGTWKAANRLGPSTLEIRLGVYSTPLAGTWDYRAECLTTSTRASLVCLDCSSTSTLLMMQNVYYSKDVARGGMLVKHSPLDVGHPYLNSINM
jgi:hypothetical protein